MKLNTSTLSRLCLIAGLMFLAAGLYLAISPAPMQAQDDDATETPEVTDTPETSTVEMPETDLQPGDEGYCLICHEGSSQTFQLADGSLHNVSVDLDALAGSVHGSGNAEGALACTDCHEGVSFPHQEPLPATDRAFTVSRSLNCISCHEEQTENIADGVHYTALRDGNLSAASCVDCHGSHDIQPPNVTQWSSAEKCGSCHVTTFDQYQHSVHGEALFAGDENVPTCTDCHGVHGIQHPTTALFRNRSPELCLECHGDNDLMEEYELSTYIEESYLSDFHGTTVSLFSQTAPNVATNKAVCYDCHGVHDILSTDDENSLVIQQNLLATCQQCHPGATSEDFPNAWLGHFEPTLESHPLLFVVNTFYDLVIPLTLGGFALLIGTDIFRRLRRLFSRKGE